MEIIEISDNSEPTQEELLQSLKKIAQEEEINPPPDINNLGATHKLPDTKIETRKNLEELKNIGATQNVPFSDTEKREAPYMDKNAETHIVDRNAETHTDLNVLVDSNADEARETMAQTKTRPIYLRNFPNINFELFLRQTPEKYRSQFILDKPAIREMYQIYCSINSKKRNSVSDLLEWYRQNFITNVRHENTTKYYKFARSLSGLLPELKKKKVDEIIDNLQKFIEYYAFFWNAILELSEGIKVLAREHPDLAIKCSLQYSEFPFSCYGSMSGVTENIDPQVGGAMINLNEINKKARETPGDFEDLISQLQAFRNFEKILSAQNEIRDPITQRIILK